MLIVEKGLITEAQLELALEEQQTTGARLGEVLMAQFGVTRADLESALTAQRAEIQSHGTQEDSEANAAVRELQRMLDEWGRNDAAAPKRPIGEIFVERGFITSGQLEDALEEQKLSGRKLGEILVSQGKLSRLRLWDALEDQAASFETPKPEASGSGLPGLRVVSDALTGTTPSAGEAPVEMWQPPAAQPTRPEHPAQVPAAADEHVTDLRDELAALAARIDELPQPSEEWREAVAELGARLDELVDGSSESQSALQRLAEQLDEERNADRELDAQVSALAQRVDRLAAEVVDRIDQVTEKVTAAAELSETDALRHDLEQLRSSLDALPAPTGDVDELASRLVTLDENLTARLQHLTDHLASAATREQAERLRRELDDLRASLDAIPAPTDDVENLTRRVEQLAESFSARLQHVTDLANEAAHRDQTDTLRHDLDQLRATLDNLPTPTDEWRDAVDTLTARVDELASGSTEARSAFERLHERIDAGDDGERRRAERIDTLASVAGELNARLEQLSHGVADATTHDQTDALRGELEELRGRVEALPVPTDEWREAVAALAVQMDSAQSSEEWRDAVAALAVRLDEVSAPSEEWRAELGSLCDRLRERVDRLEHDVATAASVEGIDAVSGQVGVLGEGLERTGRRLDQVVRRLEELAPLHRVEELADATTETASAHGAALDAVREELAAQARKAQEAAEKRRNDKAAVRERFDALEASLADTTAWSSALEPLQAHLADLDHRLSELASSQAAARRADLDALREEMHRSLDGTTSAHDAALEPLQAQLADLDHRLSELVSAQAAERRADLDALRGELHRAASDAASAHSEAFEPLQAHLAALDHRLSELASTQSAERHADLDALRDEIHHSAAGAASAQGEALEAVRAELAEQSRRADEAADTRRADTEALNRRLDQFESTLEEHAAGHDAERRADLDALRAELYQRVEQVAATSAGRSELDTLRHELEAEFGELLERQGQEDAAAQATGEAIRDGLAELARRLTASEQAYFESGRTLRRSIEGLGLAITDADWHLRTGAPADPDDEATSYVAFVPAGDAYRLVECDGPPPYLGQVVDIEGFDDVLLRVSRLGRSPLPFDGRPCAYLERLSA
jgi:chromosome segregation ATPase